MLLFTRNYREGNDPTQDHGPWTSGLMSREKSTDRGLFRAPRNTVDPNRGEEEEGGGWEGPILISSNSNLPRGDNCGYSCTRGIHYGIR